MAEKYLVSKISQGLIAGLHAVKPRPEREEKLLSDHRLFVMLLEQLTPLLEEDIKKWEKQGSLNNPMKRCNLSPLHLYCNNVFEKANNLHYPLDLLEDIQTYLRRFPISKYYEGHKITRDKWIYYHLTNYYVTAASINDIALILTNYVFGLGLPEQECTNAVVRENIWVKKTRVKQALDNIEKTTKLYRSPRNLFVHRGIHSAPKGFYIIAALNHIRYHTKQPIIPVRILNQGYRKVTKDICSQMESQREKILTAVTHLFDELLPIYMQNVRQYTTSEKFPLSC